MNVIITGNDSAKNMFSVHGVDATGKVVMKKTVSRTAMRFVRVKSAEQQAILSLHRIR